MILHIMRNCFIILMGSELCREVHSIPDRIPHTPAYSFFRGHSNRYSDLNVVAIEGQNYLFTLRLQGQREIRVTLPVLSESVHRALYINYRLSISSHMLLDFMNPDGGLQAVKNQLSGVEYSMKLLPFRSFNSLAFKQGLEEVWVHRRLTCDKELFLPLEDAFVLVSNPDQQVLVLLFAKATSSLFNVGIYRREAQWNWTLPQKLVILQQLIEGCVKMHQMQVIHRDLRPGNLLFLRQVNRYVIGGLYSCREQPQYIQQDLMTVVGVQSYTSQPLSRLIKQQSQMGLYRAKDQLYHSLLVIINFLETMSPISDGMLDHAPRPLLELKSHILQKTELPSLLASIRRSLKEAAAEEVPLFEDQLASRLTEEILKDQNKAKGSANQFRAYQLLGYSKQFSQAAHRVIEENNIAQQPLKNAVLLKQLGQFYEQNGSKGTEYLLNSCTLFCKRTESDLQRGMIDDAQIHLEQAEQLYLHLSNISDFSLTLVELFRLKSLFSARKNPKQKDVPFQATGLINKAFKLAAEKNLPIEKQMNLFLTWGTVYQEAGEENLAEERLKHGLLICENSAAFSSPSEAALLKGHFYYQLGLLLFSKLQKMHDPRRGPNDQQYSKLDIKGRAEAYLKLAMEIRQRQSSLIFDMVEVHRSLGSFYLMTSNYSQAKNSLRKAIIHLKMETEPMAIDIKAGIYYDLGSACYKLREFAEAKIQYEQTVKILRESGDDDHWRLCVEGNLALSRMQSGEYEEGREQLERTKELIKARMGANHFDYQFLDKQGEALRHPRH